MERKQYNVGFKARVAIEAIKGGEDGKRDSWAVWCTTDADSAVEEAGNARDSGDIFRKEGARRKKGGGIAVVIVSADRAIEGRAGLAEKKLGSTVEERLGLIEPGNEEIRVGWQCELMGISRSGFNYNLNPANKAKPCLQD